MSAENGHKRLRPVSFTVQPNLMVDDGEELKPLPVQPITVSAADGPKVVELMADSMGQLREQVEGGQVERP